MWNGSLVIDGVAHAYAFEPENRIDGCPLEAYRGLIEWLYGFAHVPLESTTPGYLLSLNEFAAGWRAEDLASLFFVESDVDLIAYHGVEISALFKRGSSPWEVGVELKRAYPERVLLYAPVDPFKGLAELEAMEAKAAEAPVDGWKFYPSNGVIDPTSAKLNVLMFDDPETVFPYYEKARALGIPHIAIHKAMPVGPGRLDKDRPEDVSQAALAFPDVQFEVVHSGWAFLEDCAMQLMLHPNIWANLECVTNWVVRQPARFAHIIGTLMQYGGHERIIFGTGAALAHPQPILEAFASFVMPEDLQEGFGFPALTDNMKSLILGGNMARLHGLDPDALLERTSTDVWAERRRAWKDRPGVPWHAHREHLAAPA